MDHRNFYGRTKGKALNAAQYRYLDEDLPRLSVAGITFAENPERNPLDIRELSGGRKVWVVVSIWFIRR